MSIPSRGFSKLDTGIVDSTVWMKQDDVLRVWIALLAKADSLGLVRAAVPSMAHLCFTSVERFEAIIEELCQPDPHSRTSAHEGRRLKPIEGGWCLLNYILYRDMMQGKAMSHAERQRIYRERLKLRDEAVTSVTPIVTRDTEAEAEAEAEAKEQKISTSDDVDGKTDVLPRAVCPVEKIVGLYHAILPELPLCRKVTPGRRGAIQQRWREDLTDLADWEYFFRNDVGASDFLMGRAAPTNGRSPFRADLGWITKAANFANIIEGKYRGKASRKQ